MLYIVATPIGNLEDITLRALSVLKSVDSVLCEDTRRTKKLLFHYEISVPTYSFHSFNERGKENTIITLLQNGKKIALVSDAGTPTISDPGSKLIARCHQENIPVTCIPGPSAIITALAFSGAESPFQFLGFFPKKPGEIKRILERVNHFPGTSVFFESPHRLLKTLKYIPDTLHVIIAKELTKIHETLFQGSSKELYGKLEKTSIKGEYVLLLQNVKCEA